MYPDSIINPAHRGGSRTKIENMKALNVRFWAEKNGFDVEIDRHGVYTNYILRNANGIIRIEKSTVKGHQPWIIRSNYRIWIPDTYSLFFSTYTSEYTVAINIDSEWRYANIGETDIVAIISHNNA